MKHTTRKATKRVKPPRNLPVTQKHWYARWHEFPAHKEVHWLAAIAIAWAALLALLGNLAGVVNSDTTTGEVMGVRSQAVTAPSAARPFKTVLEEDPGQVLGEETVREETSTPRLERDDVRPKPFGDKR